MKTIMVTGATHGLGLQIVKKLVQQPDVHAIMAVRNINKGNEIAKQLGHNVSVVHLDLSNLSDIRDFIKSWNTPIDGLINNAGVQFCSQDSFTANGYEETIAVNYLAAFLLTLGLKEFLTNGRVMFIGSGTHNPKHTVARLFGFRGAQYTSVLKLAKGEGDTINIMQKNNDRYATSKYLCTVTAVELARRYKDFSSYVLDPGMLPGTGLARSRNGINRFLWNWLLPVIGIFLPDTSNLRRSADAASWIMTDMKDYPSGTIFSYNKRPNKYVWREMVYNDNIDRQVFDETYEIIKKYLPQN